MSLPETVQTIVYTAHGGLEVIDKIAKPFPKQKANEILVKVRLLNLTHSFVLNATRID